MTPSPEHNLAPGETPPRAGGTPAVYRTDPEGRCVYVNDAWCRMTGLSPDEALGGGWVEGIHPEDRSEITRAWKEMIRTGAGWGRRYRFVDRQGRATPVEGHATPLFDDDGVPRGFIGTNLDATWQVRTEEDLRESERKYRLLVQHGGLGIGYYDCAGTILFFNRKATEYLGGSPEDYIGRSAMDVFGPSLGPTICERIERVASDGGSLSFEDEVPLPGGQRWFVSIYSCVPGEDGEVLGVEIVSDDITERRRSEEAARESEARFHALFESGPAPSYAWRRVNDDFVLVDFNDAAFKITAGSVADFLGVAASHLYRDRPDIAGDLSRCWSGKESFHREVEYRFSSTGEKKRLFAQYAFVPPDIVLVHALDETDRKTAEENLAKAREDLQHIFDATPDMLAVGDAGGIVLRANPVWQEVLGHLGESIVGRKFIDLVHPGDRNRTLRELLVLQRDASTRSFENRLLHGEGGYRWIQWRAVFDARRKLFYAAGRDITERREMEAALEESNNLLERRVRERTAQLEAANERLLELDSLKSMFIASMSHELRTPLNAIIGFTGVILQGMAGKINEEQRRQLSMVRNSADHLLALINEIIDIGGIEAGKAEIERSKFDLVPMLREVLDIARASADRGGLGISYRGPVRMTVTSDPRRMKQIITNLVTNAVKFTPRGSVRLEASRRGDLVEVSVHDTGVGIEDRDLPRLFRPFSRLNREGLTIEGSGLGLYLSRKIAVLLGGDISVRSRPGEGSTFTLSLPCP